MPRSCLVEACGREHHSNGYCSTHAKRVARYGRTDALTTVDRFENHLSHENGDGCWIWDKPHPVSGYGQFHGRAHRWSYEHHIGPIPEGAHLDHLCRNRACVNPWHLEPVSLVDNVMRGEGYYAANARKTHCVSGHEFTAENTYVTANGRRQCRTCRRSSVIKHRSKTAHSRS